MKLSIENDPHRAIDVKSRQHPHSGTTCFTGAEANGSSTSFVGGRLNSRKVFTFDVLFLFGLNDEDLWHPHTDVVHLVCEITSPKIRVIGK